ncbi:sulfatase family protein [Aestuariimicrobium ganziense]|uniref:sulfatase family protein n=1 Tax=Aestuariimicrobium ganziense TaxID=2773677 RepID=UPI0019425792|nr:sulfatase-like hydrolase/transferase [Aestuariimicrobium ganziense]
MGRKNIILIVSDDHGYADRSLLGHDSAVHTPALDRLAAEGTSHTDAYVTAPVCSPSRAGLISGVHQARWGADFFESSSFPPPTLPTLAERLGAQGYRTGYLGKVHYGLDEPGSRSCPEQHGFDESFYGLGSGQMGRLNYMRHSRAAQAEYKEAAAPMAVAPLFDNGEQVEHEGFLTWEIGRRARDFIARAAADEQPFFLLVAFNAVHNFCWQLPADELRKRGLPHHDDWHPASGATYHDWYDNAIVPNLEHGREYYLAQLELMDAEIGQVLDQLDELSLADDTVVVYTTDNGGSPCNYASNTPLRGTKYTLWEGGVRVPMIVRWPGVAQPGATVPGLASSLDLTPTLLRAAGTKLADDEPCDGQDLSELWTGAGEGHDALHWTTGPWSWSVRQGDWKLSWVDPDSTEAGGLRRVEHAPVGSGHFLANLADDPGEQVNLVESHPDDFARMLALHEQWADEVRTSREHYDPLVPEGWRSRSGASH